MKECDLKTFICSKNFNQQAEVNTITAQTMKARHYARTQQPLKRLLASDPHKSFNDIDYH